MSVKDTSYAYHLLVLVLVLELLLEQIVWQKVKVNR
jgi:hypothetical protein